MSGPSKPRHSGRRAASVTKSDGRSTWSLRRVAKVLASSNGRTWDSLTLCMHYIYALTVARYKRDYPTFLQEVTFVRIRYKRMHVISTVKCVIRVIKKLDDLGLILEWLGLVSTT